MKNEIAIVDDPGAQHEWQLQHYKDTLIMSD